jgi:hypothetical protein
LKVNNHEGHEVARSKANPKHSGLCANKKEKRRAPKLAVFIAAAGEFMLLLLSPVTSPESGQAGRSQFSFASSHREVLSRSPGTLHKSQSQMQRDYAGLF